MKNKFLTITLAALAVMFTAQMDAQKFEDLDKSPMDMAAYPASHQESNKLVKIAYSRPQLKGRPLEKLTPQGKVWRTGANEAAEITLYQPMKIGDKVVNAGTYSLFTIPGDDSWTIILSSDTNVWGAYSYDEANDVVRTTAKVTKADEALEAFSIAFEEAKGGAHMHLGWGTTRVAVPLMSVTM
ncbi:MAG: asparagine synthetase B [Flavobacteriaceae bacterium]|nr:asparagine synthetase B [Flavobacteriaceae bacterium]